MHPALLICGSNVIGFAHVFLLMPLGTWGQKTEMESEGLLPQDLTHLLPHPRGSFFLRMLLVSFAFLSVNFSTVTRPLTFLFLDFSTLDNGC